MSDGWQDFVAGTFAGIGGVIVGYPADTVKVRLQTQQVTAGVPLKYTGTYQCLKTIVKEESALGLFKGMLSPMAGVGLINAIIFGVYGNLLRLQHTDIHQHPTLTQIFIAGAGSGFANTIVASPIELAKIRLQNQKFNAKEGGRTFKGPTDLLLATYKSQGLKGIYRGITATILRETPSYGCYFVTYEYLTTHLLPPENSTKHELGYGQLLFAGGVSGVAGWICIYPFDVIKTRMQDNRKYIYKNTLDCAIRSYKEEGWRVFFRGLNATIIRAIPTNAITFLVYTLSMRTLMDYSTHEPSHPPVHVTKE